MRSSLLPLALLFVAVECFAPLPPRTCSRHTVAPSKGALHGQKEGSQDLYKAVAEHDPEWYSEFVLNVLGEDLVESEAIPSLRPRRQVADREEDREKAPKRSRPSGSTTGLTKSMSQERGDIKVTHIADKSAGAKGRTLEIPSNLEAEPSSCEPERGPYAMISDLSSERGSADAGMPQIVATDPIENMRPPNGPKNDGGYANPKEKTHFHAKRPERETQDEMKSKRVLDRPESTVGIADYRDRLDPKRRTSADTATAKRRQNLKVYSNARAAHEKEATTNAPRHRHMVGSQDATMGRVKDYSWFDVTMWKPSLPNKDTRRENLKAVNETAVFSAPDLAEEDYVVLYRDLYSGDLRAENLTSVTNLGYNVSEIPYMQPDALALIVEDEIRRPARGIPQQWQISQSQFEVLSDDVRIILREGATNMMEEANGKKRDATKDLTSPIEVDSGVDNAGHGSQNNRTNGPAATDRSIRRRGVARTEQLRQDAVTASSRGERKHNKRQRRPLSQSRPKGNRKRIYNVRKVPKKPSQTRTQDEDPPPPDSPLWVDLDTFRDLLRSEAELRVRILGEDWADIVKDESNWRLSLYKEWLWALHNGVGSPVVPSRSDRITANTKRRQRRRRSREE